MCSLPRPCCRPTVVVITCATKRNDIQIHATSRYQVVMPSGCWFGPRRNNGAFDSNLRMPSTYDCRERSGGNAGVRWPRCSATLHMLDSTSQVTSKRLAPNGSLPTVGDALLPCQDPSSLSCFSYRRLDIFHTVQVACGDILLPKVKESRKEFGVRGC